MTTLSNEAIVAELGWTLQLIYNSTGGRLCRFWRPPYGDTDVRVNAIAQEVFGLTSIVWNQEYVLCTLFCYLCLIPASARVIGTLVCQEDPPPKQSRLTSRPGSPALRPLVLSSWSTNSPMLQCSALSRPTHLSSSTIGISNPWLLWTARAHIRTSPMIRARPYLFL